MKLLFLYFPFFLLFFTTTPSFGGQLIDLRTIDPNKICSFDVDELLRQGPLPLTSPVYRKLLDIQQCKYIVDLVEQASSQRVTFFEVITGQFISEKILLNFGKQMMEAKDAIEKSDKMTEEFLQAFELKQAGIVSPPNC